MFVGDVRAIAARTAICGQDVPHFLDKYSEDCDDQDRDHGDTKPSNETVLFHTVELLHSLEGQNSFLLLQCEVHVLRSKNLIESESTEEVGEDEERQRELVLNYS